MRTTDRPATAQTHAARGVPNHTRHGACPTHAMPTSPAPCALPPLARRRLHPAGMMEPSGGSVHVCGLELASHERQVRGRSSGYAAAAGGGRQDPSHSSPSSPQVSRLLGICPQHDVLTDALTARETLALHARVKV
jgi:hypothetical protein